MSVIAEFDVASPDLALAEAVAAHPDVELEVVNQVGTDPNRPFLFVWVSGVEPAAFEEALAADETVAGVERYTEADGRALYRMQITDATEVVSYPKWVQLGADRLEARWYDGWWHNRMRFPDREALGDCRDWCDERDIAFQLRRVYTDDGTAATEPALTPEQLEVLRVAHEVGYFEIPRRASMADVAAELDLSSQAVSERLRRGFRQLIGERLK